MSPLLSAQGLDLGIGGRRLLRDLALTVEAGQTWGILGENGAGKSTLLHTLAGLRAPASGHLRLLGRALEAYGDRELAQLRGVLLQGTVDTFPATVLETALLGRHPHLGRWQWSAAHDLEAALAALKAVDLVELAERDVLQLSGGERQRLAIATLLCQAPHLYLLDEPLAHLDLRHQLAVLDHLAALARVIGVAVVAVLHDLNMAARYCDQVLLMFGDGDWVAGPVGSVLTEANLSRLYRHPVRRLNGETSPVFVPG